MKFLKLGCLGLLLASLTACGVVGGVVDYVTAKGSRLDWSGITVIAAEDANLNTPVALDIVTLHDDATLGTVSALSASKWFASRADLQKTFPDGLNYKSFEVVPGQTMKIPPSAFPPARQVGVLVFADYLTPGEHRVRVDQLKGDILVQLGTRSYSVTALKPADQKGS